MVVDPLDSSTPIGRMVAGSGLEVQYLKAINPEFKGKRGIYCPSSSRKYMHAFFIGNPSLQSSV